MTIVISGLKPAELGIRLERAPRTMSHEQTMSLVRQLRARAPKQTRLDTMTPQDVRKELENRS